MMHFSQNQNRIYDELTDLSMYPIPTNCNR